jgi:hypothetical protein
MPYFYSVVFLQVVQIVRLPRFALDVRHFVPHLAQIYRREWPNKSLETKPPSHLFCFSGGFMGGLSQLGMLGGKTRIDYADTTKA